MLEGGDDGVGDKPWISLCFQGTAKLAVNVGYQLNFLQTTVRTQFYVLMVQLQFTKSKQVDW